MPAGDQSPQLPKVEEENKEESNPEEDFDLLQA